LHQSIFICMSLFYHQTHRRWSVSL
jgi:hypothetical protein